MYPQCSLRVYTREADTIGKVGAAARWRLNIHVEPMIRFYSTHCQRAICFWPSVRENARKEQFSWTDDETELLLNITLDYKTEKIANGIDWESIRSKYGDIWERFSAELARMIEEASPGDFPHKPEEITKAMLSSKLKGEPSLTICVEIKVAGSMILIVL